MQSEQPTSLTELLTIPQYSKLLRTLLIPKARQLLTEKRINIDELARLNEYVSRQGLRGLPLITYRTHPFSKTSRQGGHNLLTTFFIGTQAIPYRIKIHGTKRDLKKSTQASQYLRGALGDQAACIVEPDYINTGARLAAFEVRSAQTLDELLEAKYNPEDEAKVFAEREHVLRVAVSNYIMVSRAATATLKSGKRPDCLKTHTNYTQFFTQFFIAPHDPKLTSPEAQELQQAYAEVSCFLESQKKVVCLEDPHPGNILVDNGRIRNIDIDICEAPIAYPLARILSHPNTDKDLEEKVLLEARPQIEGLGSKEDFLKAYYLSQIQEDLLAMERHLQRAQMAHEEKDGQLKQATLRYNLALRRIQTAKEKGYLTGALNEKIGAFCQAHHLDVRYVDDVTLETLRPYHKPYESIEVATEQAHPTTSPSDGEEQLRKLDWALRKPVWIQRMWRGAALLGAGLLLYGATFALNYNSIRATQQAQLKVTQAQEQATKAQEELHQALEKQQIKDGLNAYARGISQAFHYAQTQVKRPEDTIDPERDDEFIKTVAAQTRHLTSGFLKQMLIINRLAYLGGSNNFDSVELPGIYLLRPLHDSPYEEMNYHGERPYPKGRFPYKYTVPIESTPKENFVLAAQLLDRLVDENHGNPYLALTEFYTPFTPNGKADLHEVPLAVRKIVFDVTHGYGIDYKLPDYRYLTSPDEIKLEDMCRINSQQWRDVTFTNAR